MRAARAVQEELKKENGRENDDIILSSQKNK